MANKRLTDKQKEELKKLALKGVAPKDIADYFGIAISSVHNIKKQFTENGVKFPDVKGQRPTGNLGKASPSAGKPQEVQPSGSFNNLAASVVPINAPQHNEPSLQIAASGLDVTVNGVTVHVEPGAKNVTIAKGSINIDF
jgi:hypothetical protein